MFWRISQLTGNDAFFMRKSNSSHAEIESYYGRATERRGARPSSLKPKNRVSAALIDVGSFVHFTDIREEPLKAQDLR